MNVCCGAISKRSKRNVSKEFVKIIDYTYLLTIWPLADFGNFFMGSAWKRVRKINANFAISKYITACYDNIFKF